LRLRTGLLCLFFLFGSLATALDPGARLDHFSYQTWQTGSGLPQNTIHSVLQTQDGFLWVATEGGLARFDAYQFLIFDSRNTDALKSDNIRALVEDTAGTLWIGTGNGLATRHGDRFESSDLGIGKSVLGLCSDREGGIWAITADSLIHRKKDGSSEAFSAGEGAPKFTGSIANAEGAIWLGTQTGLIKFENPIFVSGGSGLPNAAVNALLFDQATKLWVGTAKGLYTAEQRATRRFQATVDAPAGESIFSLLEDQHGIIWAGTQNGLRRLAKYGGIAFESQAVIALGQDAEGDLWVGSEAQGVTVLRDQRFYTFTTRNGLADDAVRCIFESRSGVLSIGTNAGLSQMQGRRVDQLTTGNGLSSNVILSLGEDRNGSLLLGTPDGLNRVRDNRISITTSADGLADDFVRSIYLDKDRSLWVGTRRGLSHEESPDRFKTYTEADGLGSDLVGAILRDHAGDLWVGTLNGLSRLHDGRFTNYRASDGLSSSIITALYEESVGDLWIGTQDAGLNLWTKGKFARFPVKQGLPTSIFGIAEDFNGELWLASKAGIVRANKNELKAEAAGSSASATAVWYGTSDGLRINECSAGGHPEVWKGVDGTIWFSTVKGAAALYPSAARLNRVPTPVVIESIAIDDQRFMPEQVQRITPGHARFMFEYAGLSFAAPQKVIYRYKLEGFDKNWVEAGAQRTASYTNIPPGRYSFQVMARNGDGFWNEKSAGLAFVLEPHFYQTFWFYALVGLAVAGASYLIYRWRVAEVEARFDAVLQERNRIGREIHDTLAQGFVGVSVQLEIVSRLLGSSTDVARHHLDQARVLVRESLAEARRSIWQLRSQSAESIDLAGRLSKAARQATELSPVKLSMEVRGTYRPLERHVEDELLRIGQEAVMNALRHAKCERIDIELAYGLKNLLMMVSDNGCGFDPRLHESGSNGHFGLRGMRERAEQIHATLAVDSAEGKGTRVSVEAPLN
jgi:signal transduction histidine kinase/ligand-binding sensor domain-containing protein